MPLADTRRASANDAATASDPEDVTRTLLYWMDVEALTPPDAEEDRDTNARGMFEARHVPDRDFPWRDRTFGHPDRRYKHFVRFGIFGRERYQADIIRALSTTAEQDHDTRKASKAVRFGFAGVFEVDANGMAVLNGLLMPAFGLAFESLRLGNAADLDDDLDAFRRRMKARFNDLADTYAGKSRQVDEAFVDAMREAASGTLTWLRDLPRSLPLAVVRSAVSSVFVEVVSKKEKDAAGKPLKIRRERQRKAELPPVDSFYFDDIRLVMRAARNGNGGLAVPFLRGTSERIDCTDRAFVARACTASSHSRARWPSKHDMSLMQQVAVDLATATLADGGLFSVNGPPGTGKTTLLMDIVADVILRRAETLCTFPNPAAAFERNSLSEGVHALDPKLLDSLIVVASSNNEAVKNITQDLPSIKKIDLRYLDGFRFLAPAAEALLAASPDEDVSQEDGDQSSGGDVVAAELPLQAWGLMSATLGNKENRGKFTSTLQRREPDGPQEGQPSECNLFRLLDEARTTFDWETERAAFERATLEVGMLRAEISAAEPDAELAAMRERIATLQDVLERQAVELQATGRALSACEADRLQASEAFIRAERGVDLVTRTKPSGLLAVFRRGAMATWRTEVSDAVARRADADRGLGAAQSAHRLASRVHGKLSASMEATEFGLRKAKEAVALGEATSVALASRHPGLVTVADVTNETDAGRREQMLPGSSMTLKDARARLFVAAMRVHLAFVCAAGPDLFDQNLETALDMLRGRSKNQTLALKAAPHLWATLALVTPVVSTTFASLSRCFAPMGAGSIPWLLVDEAGQAVPHQALGGVWRAKRALVVGDPFQVEPVVTMDRNADAKLAERRRAPDRHRATLASAQTLADAANPFGTWVQSRGGKLIWIGCPLKVHRRCVEPMFGISNRLAYDGVMVLADGKTVEEATLTAARPLLGRSRWIDVTAKQGGPKHFVREQADAVCLLVRAYVERGFGGKDGLPALFVISPFRSMADGLRKSLCDGLQAQGFDKKALRAWSDGSVGTVHAFQGKEREVVILALGGTSDGAIEWACGTPNILNVAVTRAQRRLYVVGDRARWMAASSLLAEFRAMPVERAIVGAAAT